MRRVITRLIPSVAKESIRGWLRDIALRRAVSRLGDLSPAEVTQPQVLREFRAAFGNEGFSGDVRFLSEAAQRANRSDAPLLECGSGASTLLIGHLLARRGIRLVSLEQDAGWFQFIRRDLQRLGLSNVDVYHAPLSDQGDFDWYDVSSVSFPPRFETALCDGPAFCRGWRCGLLPMLVERGVQFDEILCDDADDAHAPAMFAFWEERFGIKAQLLDGADGAMAVVRPEAAWRAPARLAQ